MNKLLKEYHFEEVWLGGGVAANTKLRQMIRETIKPYGLKLKVPYTRKLNMDNGAMIGVVANYKIANQTTQTNTDFDRRPRWKIEEN